VIDDILMKIRRLNMKPYLLFINLCLMIALSPLYSQVSPKFSYQGYLSDHEGNVLNQQVKFHVRLFDSSSGGDLIWEEQHEGVEVVQGVFSIYVGNINSLGDIPFDRQYWMSISVDDVELSPRIELTSIPYCFMARSVEDGAITGEKIAVHSITAEKIAEDVFNDLRGDKPDHEWSSTSLRFEKPDGSWGSYVNLKGDKGDAGDLELPFTGSTSSGEHGIRVTHTAATNSITYGGYFESASTIGRGVYGKAPYRGVVGEATANSGYTDGGYFKNVSVNGKGVHGIATASTGNTYGGYFDSFSTEGKGVSGYASAKSGTTYGGYFASASPDGRGVYGQSPYTGVEGEAFATSGDTYGGKFLSASTNGRGVLGIATASTGTVYGGFFYINSSSGSGVYGGAHASTGTTYGGFFASNSSSGFGVYGGAYAGTGTTYGGFFASSSTTGKGVYGYATAGTGANYGGYFKSNSTSGTGVYGIANATSGATHGGYFLNKSSSGIGVFGESEYIGVRGWNTATSGITYGGFFTTNSTSGRAVYGHAGETNAYAGYFDGRVVVTGRLSKAGGEFVIDHPLDPANKILRHSFVESPDMMNVYNGNIKTDGSGEAVVLLPDYFESLNMDFRYQLTVIGVFAQAMIAQKISGNRFIIRTDKPNVEVSWQVTGVRKDPWAEENRTIVEEYKKPEVRGYYLHPQPYGQPETRSVQWGENPEMMRMMDEERDRQHIQQERLREEMQRMEDHDRLRHDQERVKALQQER
jgi:trimeric autotransporter adhesin